MGATAVSVVFVLVLIVVLALCLSRMYSKPARASSESTMALKAPPGERSSAIVLSNEVELRAPWEAMPGALSSGERGRPEFSAGRPTPQTVLNSYELSENSENPATFLAVGPAAASLRSGAGMPGSTQGLTDQQYQLLRTQQFQGTWPGFKYNASDCPECDTTWSIPASSTPSQRGMSAMEAMSSAELDNDAISNYQMGLRDMAQLEIR
jgi:hypothetical protein